jgi:hypothetical protein
VFEHWRRVDIFSFAVDIDNFWHFGPDMARFAIDVEKPVITGWFVMVDLEESKIDFTYLMTIRPDLEDIIEKELAKPGGSEKTLEKILAVADKLELSEDTLNTLKKIL